MAISYMSAAIQVTSGKVVKKRCKHDTTALIPLDLSYFTFFKIIPLTKAATRFDTYLLPLICLIMCDA